MAKVLKTVNFMLFRSILPYECEIQPDITLWHRGLGTVIHPNSTIGERVTIGHGVTFGASSNEIGSPLRVFIGDDVVVGAHAYIAGTKGRPIRIGRGAMIGAHAIVVEDVAENTKMVGPKSHPIS
ncbi:serine acetyltransferase [Rhodococcus globerulus]|nr:serine acetyltransferase [Rhodococcus globerulus]